MPKFLVSMVGTLILAGGAWAASLPVQGSAKLRCTLTNRTIEKCCCRQQEGKLYCTLAKKTIDKCCCVPAAGSTSKK